MIDALPDGLATPLSARYSGGVDVSGGQWQRIALSRALFALEQGTSVLVLDEPTANLDVRAEAELFDRFIEITGGATTILISHRFSTVRRADRIVVLDGGAIVEQGTHDELVARGGRYEELFRLQAARFALGRGRATSREALGRRSSATWSASRCGSTGGGRTCSSGSCSRRRSRCRCSRWARRRS